jgi:PqqD family protein of HPr-rel-A system
MAEAPSRWRALPPDELNWRAFDDEVVVRNDRTGTTHALTPPAGRIFLALLAQPGGIALADLIRSVDETSDPDDRGRDGRAAIEFALSEFERLGLAWPEKP